MTAIDVAPKTRTAGPFVAWFAVLVLCLAQIVSTVDRGMLALVIDPLRHDLQISEIQIALLQGFAFAVFYVSVGLPLGLLADFVNRRRLLIAGVLVWSLATIGGGFAQSFGALFASRLLVGLGEAALGPAAVSLIADLFPPDRRGRPLSVYLAGQAIASGLAISVTSLIVAAAARGQFANVPVLADAAPWRAAFIACGAIGLFVSALLMTMIEPTRKGQAGAPALTTSFADKIAFLRRNTAVLVPLYLGFALCFMAAYGAAAWSPTMLIRRFGIGPAEIGTWLGPFTIAFSVAGPLIGGVLIDRFAKAGRDSAKFGILIVAPFLAIPAMLAVFAPTPITAMLMVASSGAVFALIGTTLFATLAAVMPPDMRGTSIAISGLVNTLVGATLGPLLVAGLTEHAAKTPGAVGHSIALVAIPALLVGAILFAIARRAVLRAA
jgi:MFS family permease